LNKLIKDFKQQGFVIVPNLIPGHVCDFLRHHAETIVDNANLEEIKPLFIKQENGYVHGDYFFASSHRIHFFLDKNALDASGNFKVEKKFTVNKLGHGLHEVDIVFFRFSKMPAIINLLHQLDIVHPTLLQSMYLFKQPYIGDEVGCHQDETFITPTSGNLIGLWFALEDATIENSCLWVIPKGHLLPLKRKMIRTKDNQLYMEEYPVTWSEEAMIPLEVKKGSVIALHGLLPHMSQPNRSQQSRHAYTLHVISQHQQLAVGNWLSPDGCDRFVQL